jgi:hypothetical protein
VVRGTFTAMTPAIARRLVASARRLVASAVAVALASAVAASGCSGDSAVSRTLGARCDRGDECDDRCLAPGPLFPGGFCSVSCEASAECPSGASCVDADAGVCLLTCAEDRECELLGVGWRCLDVSLREDAARKEKVCLGG